jgi:hypothetical protein
MMIVQLKRDKISSADMVVLPSGVARLMAKDKALSASIGV